MNILQTLIIIWLSIGLITYIWQLRRRRINNEPTSFKRMMILLIIIPFGIVSLYLLLNDIVDNNHILTILFKQTKNN